MLSNRYIFSFLFIVIFVLSITTTWYENLVYILFGFVILLVLDKLGKGIVLREIILLHTTLVCLIMPLLGYNVYNANNELAQIWFRYMLVSPEDYFGFTLPAVTAFAIALCWPMNDRKADDEGISVNDIIEQIKLTLSQNSKVGVVLLISGILIFQIGDIFPTSLKFIFQLFYYTSFVGLLYVYYSKDLPFRRVYLVLFILYILILALQSGMFTIVAYMGMTIFSFFFLGKKVSLPRKVIFFAASIFILLVIQAVKPAYRKLTWKQNYSENKASLFFDLASKKISKGEILDPNSFFFIYYRINQGYNISMVMRRVPLRQPHDEGKILLRTITASIVPRFLWPDKPEAGGKFNMRYYAGYVLKGFSTNIGPLGEAYGGFGVYGGVCYMFFLGLFIRYAYKKIFLISKRFPIIILWIPVLFFQTTYSAETDTHQILNSLIKSAVFVFVLYKFLPFLFSGKPVSKVYNNKVIAI